MNLSQLYYFRKLAELEHYGKASEELYITQPSLSNSISNLEKELGVPLFERVGRNVRLTSYGAEFNEHIVRALGEVDKAVDLMKLYSSGLSGQIRLGTVISIQRNFLPMMLSSFRKEFGENVVFDIHQGTTYNCIKGVLDGKLDMAFCGQLVEERQIAYAPMLSQSLVAGVHVSHPLSKNKSVSFDDLKNYDLISYRPESYGSTILDNTFRERNIQAKPAFNDEISAASLVCVEKNLVAIMLQPLDEEPIEGFVSIPIEDVSEAFHTIYLAYKDKAFHSLMADQLIEFAQQFSSFPKGVATIADFRKREKENA